MIKEIEEVKRTIGGRLQPTPFDLFVNTPVIPSNTEEKNVRTGFGGFTLGVRTGVGDAAGRATCKGLVKRLAGATTKSAQPTATSANGRARCLPNRLFTTSESALV